MPPRTAKGVFEGSNFAVPVKVLRCPGRKHDRTSFGDGAIVGALPFFRRSRTQRVAELIEYIPRDGFLSVSF